LKNLYEMNSSGCLGESPGNAASRKMMHKYAKICLQINAKIRIYFPTPALHSALQMYMYWIHYCRTFISSYFKMARSFTYLPSKV